MPVPILLTKLFTPSLPLKSVVRPRLFEKKVSVLDKPGAWVLLAGPAGFGKTTLLAEFKERTQQPLAWYSLDTNDNDPMRFRTYFIAALQTV